MIGRIGQNHNFAKQQAELNKTFGEHLEKLTQQVAGIAKSGEKENIDRSAIREIVSDSIKHLIEPNVDEADEDIGDNVEKTLKFLDRKVRAVK